MLARAYGKLGIRSRAELGAWLAGRGSTGGHDTGNPPFREGTGGTSVGASPTPRRSPLCPRCIPGRARRPRPGRASPSSLSCPGPRRRGHPGIRRRAPAAGGASGSPSWSADFESGVGPCTGLPRPDRSRRTDVVLEGGLGGPYQSWAVRPRSDAAHASACARRPRRPRARTRAGTNPRARPRTAWPISRRCSGGRTWTGRSGSRPLDRGAARRSLRRVTRTMWLGVVLVDPRAPRASGALLAALPAATRGEP